MCAAKPGAFYCVYLPEGGDVTLSGLTKPLPCFWLDPKTGRIESGGQTNTPEFRTSAPSTQPWVLLVRERAAGGRS